MATEADWIKVDMLRTAGLSEREIARQTGIARSTLRRRLRARESVPPPEAEAPPEPTPPVRRREEPEELGVAMSYEAVRARHGLGSSEELTAFWTVERELDEYGPGETYWTSDTNMLRRTF